MGQIRYNKFSEEMLEQLMKGAFLTVKNKDGRLNTMTIGWGTVGYMWARPVFMVMVRYSRYTYELMENAEEFTISFPLKNQYKKELLICGTKSGRDIDKFHECNLTAVPSRAVKTPLIGDCDLYYECRIVYKQAMDPEFILSKNIHNLYGDEKDYHILYYGEILSCHEGNEEE